MTEFVLSADAYIPRGQRARVPTDAELIAKIVIANVLHVAFWVWVFA